MEAHYPCLVAEHQLALVGETHARHLLAQSCAQAMEALAFCSGYHSRGGGRQEANSAVGVGEHSVGGRTALKLLRDETDGASY